MEDMDPHHAPQYNPLYDHIPVTFFRLENFESVVARIERRYGMAQSSEIRGGRFTSDHHVPKQPMCRDAALAFLRRGMPLRRPPDFGVPVVDRDVLRGTAMGEVIERVFARDIALYDCAIR